jgi:UDP-N-acetylglucosamine acyltransferase
MTYSHIAHDCAVGNNVIMSNATQLAGHVSIGECCVIGGMVKVHQFCSVGKYSMVAADAMVVKDITPFALTGREPVCIEGVNKIGLRRRGIVDETIMAIEQFYKVVFYSGLNTTDGLEHYLSLHSEIVPEVQDCIDFIKISKRGIYRA